MSASMDVPAGSQARTPDGPRVILAEGDEATRRALAEALEGVGYRVFATAAGKGAVSLARRHAPAAAVLDLRPEDADGLSTLDGLLACRPGLPVVVLAASPTVALAVTAMKHGAADVLAKPVTPADLLPVIERLVPRSRRDDPASAAALAQAQEMEDLGILGGSVLMRRVYERVKRIAPHYRTMLILGESGTGKEIIARALHALGPGPERPFVAVNCATLSEALLESEIFGHERGAFPGAETPRVGMMEAADTGTLFLDQVNEMGPACQAKLLRAVERREFRRVGGTRKIKVDLRLIVTSNVDLEEWVTQKRFRADLYYRLKVLTLALPPLRERREAIPILAERFLADVARASGLPRKRLAPAALAQLVRYDWPGNVRQLSHMIEDLALLGTSPTLDAIDLPEVVRGVRSIAVSIPMGTTLAEAERRLIQRTLENQATVKDAARVLGIGLRTLHTKLKQYGLRGRK
jgi:DNA-binding NtrC family response regulator